jgi:two-component system sensor histidine kinase DesK
MVPTVGVMIDEGPWWWGGMAVFTTLLGLSMLDLAESAGTMAVHVAAVGAAAVFGVIVAWLAVSRHPREDATAQPLLGALAVITMPLTVIAPHQLFFLATLGALSGLLLPPHRGLLVVAGVVLATLVVTSADRNVQGTVGQAIQVGAFGGFCYGWSRLEETNRELAKTREALAWLAVAQERARFSRDLHDLLGHSLTVIRAKSELASRLAVSDHERAGAEMAQVEQLARAALVEVREAVTGFRPVWEVELERATTGLRAAGIEPEVNEIGPPVPEPVGQTLAWVVREATTNVIRHSHASRCRISLSIAPDGVQVSVVDDGSAAANPVEGHGLRGMRERVTAAGGALRILSPTSGGVSVHVSLPLVLP